MRPRPWWTRMLSDGWLEPQAKAEQNQGGACFSPQWHLSPMSKWLSAGCGEQNLSLDWLGPPASGQLPCSQVWGSRLGG